MEQYQQVNGLILRSRDYKEADQLLTVYTREQGKITVQARGVKKQPASCAAAFCCSARLTWCLLRVKAFLW